MATLNIYRNGVLFFSGTSSSGNVVVSTGGAWWYKPSGSLTNCTSGGSALTNGFYEWSQIESGKCESNRVGIEIGRAHV